MGQVGQTSLAVVPTMKGFRSRVNAESKAAAKQGGKSIEAEFGRTGVAAGRKMGAGVKSGAADAKRAVNDLSKANASATAAWATANRQNEDQLGRVRVAQAKLNDTVKKYGEGSTQAISAQERLSAAQRKSEETGVKLVNAQTRMGESQKALKVGQDQLASALEKTNKASGRAGGGFSRFAAGARGAVTSVGSALGRGLSGVWSGIQRAASVTGQAIGTAFKVGAGVAGVAIAGLLVKMTTGGFSRLANIENAQAKMTGLGFAAEDIKSAMDGASEAVDGTSFALDEMAGAASVAMAAGLKPGEELNGYMKTLKNAASAANAPLSEMGPIMNKVVTSQKAYTAEINQIADRGLPIWSKLQEAYGVTAEELREMVSAGEVDAATFFSVMDEMTGSVADAMGNTTTSKIKNFGAALNKLGADMLGGLYPVLGPLFDAMKSGVQMIQAVLKPAFDDLGGSVSPLTEQLTGFVDKWNEIKEQIAAGGDPLALISESFPKFGAFLEKLQDGVAALPQILENFGSMFGPIAEALGPLAEQLGPVLGEAFKALADALLPILPMLGETLLNAIVEIAPPLADLLSAIVPLVPPLAELLAAIVPLAAEIVEMLVPAISWLLDLLGPFITDLGTALNYITGGIDTTQFVTAVGETGGPLKSMVQGMIDWVQSIREFAMNAYVFVRDTLSNILSFFQGVKDFFQQVALTVATIWQNIVNAISTAISTVVSVVSTGLNNIAAWWNQTWSNVANFVGQIWSNVTSAVSTGISNVISVVSGLPGKVLGALGSFGTLLVSVGRDMIQGLINGIGDMVNAAVNAVKDVGGKMLDGVKNFLGIKSPSRKMMEVGKFVGKGLEIGVLGTVDQVKAASKKLATAITDQFAKLGITDPASVAAQKNLIQFVNDQSKALEKLAGEREKILKKLDKANKLLDGRLQVRTDWISGIREGINQLGEIAGRGSADNMIENLQRRVKATKEFQSTMAKLSKMGLDKASVEELTSAFAQDGDTRSADALLAGGKKAVKQVSTLRKQLDSAGKKLGTTTGDQLYKSGIDAAKGLVRGLESQQKAIEKAAQRIARTLRNTIRKTLQIKSPSRATFQDGGFAGEGLWRGMDSERAQVEQSASGLAEAALGALSAVTEPGSVTLGLDKPIQAGPNPKADVTINNEINMFDRDPRIVGKQIGRGVEGVLVG